MIIDVANHPDRVKELIIFSAIVAGGALIGWLIEQIVLSKLLHLTSRTKWKGDDLIIQSLKGVVLPLFILLAIHIGFNYVTLNAGLLDVLHKTVKVGAILVFTIYLARIVTRWIAGETKEDKSVPSSIILNSTRITIIAVGFLIALQSIGISITPLLTALGVGGLAVALALQPTLSNFFSGLHILATKKVRVGDFIRLDTGIEGYVMDISWRSTLVRQLANNMVIIPNAKLAEAIVINTHLPDKDVPVMVEVGVAYDSDLDLVEKVAIETAREILKTVEGGVKSFDPVVRFHTFGESSINFTVILRVHEYSQQFLVKHAFVKLLHKRFREKGIEIPFPIRTIITKTP
ncbi:MAG TPA: mechanosensitive ion channel [Bacteroidales bacterium]|nr:mechanosensitive ion channel [Bacteroidales bacterium]